MSQNTTFNPRSNVNLRRIELTLISRLNQLELHLEHLTEAQEQLIYTTDYLQQTSAPFLVLSYISLILKQRNTPPDSNSCYTQLED